MEGRPLRPAAAPYPAPCGPAMWDAAAAVRLGEALSGRPDAPPSSRPSAAPDEWAHGKSAGPAPACWGLSELPDAVAWAPAASWAGARSISLPDPDAVDPPGVPRAGLPAGGLAAPPAWMALTAHSRGAP